MKKTDRTLRKLILSTETLRSLEESSPWKRSTGEPP